MQIKHLYHNPFLDEGALLKEASSFPILDRSLSIYMSSLVLLSWNILVGLSSNLSAKDRVSIIGILSFQENMLFLPMEVFLG